MTMATSFADAPGSGAPVNRNVNIDFSSDVSGFTQGVNQATAAVQQLTGALGAASQHAESLSKAVGTKLAHFTIGDFSSLAAATGVAARFEHQLGTLNATASITGASMSQMKTQLTGVFQQFPVWREQVVALATAINNMGVSRPKDVGTLTASYTKLGAATGEDPTALAASGIGLAKQMGNLDASRIDKYNNALVTLSKTAGVSAQSITDFASALAPFARQAGIGESAVLGISTAFQKAGADGMVAANAFNQLLSTITTLKQTGGDVSKYSSFLGMTQQQFRGTSTLSSAQQIFQGVAAGGPRAAVFAQDLGGLRAQGAIQRVAQSGDLSNMINLSQASSGNTGNLDKSSKAAFDSLTDSMTGLRNEFTELATLIGGPLVTPMKDLINVVSSAVHGINFFVNALGPVVPALGVLAGTIATVAAVGLAHSGAAMAIGGARYAFGKNAGWRVAGRAGRQVTDAVAGGMSPDDAMKINETGRRIQAGEPVPWHMQQAFNMGLNRPTLPPGPPTGVWGQVKTAFAGGRAGVYAGSGKLADWVTTMNNQQINPRVVGATSPWDPGGRLAPGTPALPGTEGWANAAKNMARYPMLLSGTLGAGVGAGADAMRNAMPDTALGTAGKIGFGAVGLGGRAWQGISKASSVVGGAMMNPLVMAGMGIGLPLAGAAVDYVKNANAKPLDVSESMSGASKYDQMLDSTSTNLAHFADATSSATDRLSKLANTPVNQLTAVDSSDVSAVMKGGYQAADPALAKIVKSGASNDTILAYMNAQGLQAGDVGGDRFTKMKEDLLSAKGVGAAGDVSSIMSGFAGNLQKPGGIAGGQTNFDLLAQGAAKSSDYKSFMGAALAGEVAGTQNSGDAGGIAALSNITRMGGKSLVGDTGDRNNQASFAAMMQTVYNIDPKELQKQMLKGARSMNLMDYKALDTKGHLTDSEFKDEGSSAQVVAYGIAHTDQGKALMDRYHLSEADLVKMSQTSQPLPAATSSTNVDLARMSQQGPLGKAMAGQAAVIAANAEPGNVARQSTGTSAMLSSAMSMAGENKGAVEAIGGAAQAANDLREEAAHAGGALADMANNAADAADALAKAAQITVTPGQAAIQTVQGAVEANQGLTPTSSKEQVAAAGAKTTDAITAVNDQTQRNRGMLQALNSYNTQQIRADQDYQTQVDQTNLSFTNQQARANLQYRTSVARTNRDFGIQTQRADAQNQLQRSRSTEDFNISQGRATKQYELGRSREIIAANLQVARQTQDFHINQARELQDYQTQTKRSNLQYNLGVAREEEDFHTSQIRATEDYNTSRVRQVEDYHTQVARATRDFNTQQARTAEDFNTQMKRQAEQAAQNIYDPWSRTQRKATASAGSLLKNLTSQNADIAKQIAELAQAKKLGVSEQTIQELDLSNPANAQQLDSLIKTLKRDPNLVGKINQQVATRVTSTKALTQTNDTLGYANQMEDFTKQNARAIADFKKQMADGAADLTKSMTRGYEDFIKETTRAQQDEDKSLKRGAADHQTELAQSEEDFKKNQIRETADFKKTLLQQSQDLKTSLKNEAVDFNTQMSNSQDDFDKQMARMQTDFETAQANAKQDHTNTLSDMKTDFSNTMSQAVTDHGIALSQMTLAYSTAQQRAGEDLSTTFKQYTGGLNDSMTQMTGAATAQMQKYAPGAAASWAQALHDSLVISLAGIQIPGFQVIIGPSGTTVAGSGVGTGWQQQPGGPGNGIANGATSANTAGSSSANTSSGGGGGGRGARAYATGGISLNEQLALVSEKGPELHLPLDETGAGFMKKLFATVLKDVAGGTKVSIGGPGEVSTMPIMSRLHRDAMTYLHRGGKVGFKPDPHAWAGSGYAAAGGRTGDPMRVLAYEKEKAAKEKADAEMKKRNAEEKALKDKEAAAAKAKADKAKHDALVKAQNDKAKHDALVKAENAKKEAAAKAAKAKADAAHHNAAATAGHPVGHPATHPAAAAHAVSSQQQLANLIAKAMAHEMVPLLRIEENLVKQVMQHEDHSVSFSGAQIKVYTEDANKMAKDLAAKARLKKLTSPVKH